MPVTFPMPRLFVDPLFGGGGPLVWDEIGQRRFQSGLDRGVLYPRGAAGVPWNGLVSVTEGNTRESKSYYSDGIKYLEHEVLGEFAGKVTAFTYPDAFEAIQGRAAYYPGVFVHDQPSSPFGLSYRTMVGNDLDEEAGYIIHMLWNLRARADDQTHTTKSATTEPEVFGWTLSSTPITMFGARPTAHLSVDSRLVDPELLEHLEAILYGDDFFAPSLPALADDVIIT